MSNSFHYLRCCGFAQRHLRLPRDQRTSAGQSVLYFLYEATLESTAFGENGVMSAGSVEALVNNPGIGRNVRTLKIVLEPSRFVYRRRFR
jgi:hypothetical protein